MELRKKSEDRYLIVRDGMLVQAEVVKFGGEWKVTLYGSATLAEFNTMHDLMKELP